ncbi:MAG: hypothetical protein SVV80_09605 [Planctomycetota bacterium]|nr:hypothetical protein [Planctomycetota bacterium]
MQLLLVAKSPPLTNTDKIRDDDGRRYPEVGEEITAFTWAQKELIIEKGPLAEAELSFYAYEYEDNASPLFVEINGKVSKIPAGKTPGEFKWLTVKVPASGLRAGRNDIVFKSDSTTFNSWVLGISARCHYNRSAKGYINGAVWDYHRLGHDCSINGEYMVRLVLKRPAQKHAGKPSPLKPFPEHPAGASTGPEYTLDLKDEIKKTPKAFADGTEVPFNLTFSTEQEFDLDFRDREIDIRSRPSEVILADWVNILDETGNSSLTDNTNKNLPFPPARADDRMWLRKELLVEDPDVFAAQIIFLTHQTHIPSRGTKKAVPLAKVPPLYIDVNGHTITFPSQVSWRNRSGMDWFVTDVPVKYLKKGVNNIVFRSDKGSTWRFGIENSLIPNRSAQSTDGGKTWNYDALGIRGDHNGEFLIRLRLKRYAPSGNITSPVIDLAEETSSEKIKKQIIPKKSFFNGMPTRLKALP